MLGAICLNEIKLYRSIKLLCCIFFFASGCATSTYMKVPPQWLSKFHLLKPNMTQNEVLQIMGKPSAVQIHQANVPQWPGRSIIWSYNHWQMGGTRPRSYSITMPGQIVGEVITVGGRYASKYPLSQFKLSRRKSMVCGKYGETKMPLGEPSLPIARSTLIYTPIMA